MKVKLIFTVFFFTLLLFTSCQKEEQTAETWFRYSQTKCADSWDSSFILFVSLEASIEYYFENETEITIDEIEILPDEEEGEDCEACNCTTGTVIRVRADEEFTEAMLAEGFEEE